MAETKAKTIWGIENVLGDRDLEGVEKIPLGKGGSQAVATTIGAIKRYSQNGMASQADLTPINNTLQQHANTLQKKVDREELEEIEDELEYKANADGYYQPMRVGSCDALANTGEDVEYRELIGGRMVNNAPDQMGSRVPNSTSAVTDIYLKTVAGDVVGGNQVMNIPTPIRVENNGLTFIPMENVKGWKFSGTANASTTIPLNFGSIPKCVEGHTYMMVSGLKTSEQSTIWWQITTNGTGMRNTFIWKQNSQLTSTLFFYTVAGYTWENRVFIPSLLDLTTIFPTDPDFVSSLTRDDYIRVLHRLGFYSYTINSQSLAVTHNNDDLLQLGAEVIARVGYQEPKMTLSNVGRINLISGKTGAKKYSVDIRLHIKKAWEKVLERIEERGNAIPDIIKEPRLCKVNNNVGIFLRPDGIEVSAWVEDLGRLNWNRDMLSNGNWAFYNTNAIPSMKYDGTANMVSVKYQAKDSGSADSGAYTIDQIVFSKNNKQLFIVDKTIEQASAFKAAMQGQYLVYPLAEPIFIPFEELGLGKLALSFVDVMPYDIWTLDDMDGNPMYKVESAENASHVITSRIYPNPEWVESNKQLPVAIDTVLSGFKTSANYALIMDMLRRINNAGL